MRGVPGCLTRAHLQPAAESAPKIQPPRRRREPRTNYPPPMTGESPFPWRALLFAPLYTNSIPADSIVSKSEGSGNAVIT